MDSSFLSIIGVYLNSNLGLTLLAFLVVTVWWVWNEKKLLEKKLKGLQELGEKKDEEMDKERRGWVKKELELREELGRQAKKIEQLEKEKNKKVERIYELIERLETYTEETTALKKKVETLVQRKSAWQGMVEDLAVEKAGFMLKEAELEKAREDLGTLIALHLVKNEERSIPKEPGFIPLYDKGDAIGGFQIIVRLQRRVVPESPEEPPSPVIYHNSSHNKAQTKYYFQCPCKPRKKDGSEEEGNINHATANWCLQTGIVEFTQDMNHSRNCTFHKERNPGTSSSFATPGGNGRRGTPRGTGRRGTPRGAPT